LTVEVQGPADAELALPDVGKELHDFTVRESSPVEQQTVDGRRLLRQRFEIDSNLPGQREVPALAVAAANGEVRCEPLTIEVESAVEGEVDPTKFADISGPVAVKRPWSWVPVYVAGAGALALAGLVWWMLRRRNHRLAMPAPVPPPHVWALRQLEALLAERLIEQGRTQEFYYRLSDILRTYVELQFGLMAPERTTQEFLMDLRRSDALRYGHRDLLGEFLTACDLVKFARHEPGGAEIDVVVDSAQRFLRETAPAATVTTEDCPQIAQISADS